MRPNSLKAKLAAGQPVVSGWLSIPSSYSAEIIARQGFDCVNVDLQHGMIGIESAIPMLQAISATDATPIARVGSNDPAIIMKLLDAGAYGIICPMVSSAGDAARFVSACRYPPAGERSFGPARGLLYGGPDYFAHANAEILTMAMIETVAGVENLEEIVAVDGLDALFIGPNDLSLAYGKQPLAEPQDDTVTAAISRVLDAASMVGMPVGIFCSSPAAAARRLAQGFRFVVPGNDAGLLTKAAREALAGARDEAAVSTGQSSRASGY
ncbi:MAG TPA: aldolase/citrate lyase family protein [Devosiaceae bacterium]